jgi:hypothetical protein
VAATWKGGECMTYEKPKVESQTDVQGIMGKDKGNGPYH